MQFKVLNQDELIYKNRITSGIYNFEVIEAEETVSRQDTPMIKILLKVTNGEENHRIFDYISSEAVWKIKQFLDAINDNDSYSRGELNTEDCVGRKGLLKLRTYESEFGTQTRVAAYAPCNMPLDD